MKPYSVLMLMCLFVSTSVAQVAKPVEKCALKIDQSPEVRGLKLNQSSSAIDIDDIDLRVARRGETEIGVFQTVLSPYKYRERLQGIQFVTLIYLDDKLSSFEILYSPDVKWQSDSHFAAAIAEQLKLPTVGWVRSYDGLHLNCDGFSVAAGHVFLGGQLTVEVAGLKGEIARRKAALDQKKRVEFKP